MTFLFHLVDLDGSVFNVNHEDVVLNQKNNIIGEGKVAYG